MSDGRKRPPTSSNLRRMSGKLRQWSNKIQQFENEKLKLKRWFTILKNKNNFTKN
jgi:hypothetical protein